MRKNIRTEEEIKSADKFLFKRITKEFLEYKPEKELKKANSYKILNLFHHKDNIQYSRNLKKVKSQEDIELKKGKQFQIFKKEEKIKNEKQETAPKAPKTNLNNLFSYNFENEQNLLSKRSLSFSKNTNVLNKNNITNIDNNLKVNNDKSNKIDNLITFSFKGEKEENNINKLNQINQIKNLEVKKYENNNLSNVLDYYSDNRVKINYTPNLSLNNNYISSINININNFNNKHNYNNFYNPISQSSIYYRKYPNPYGHFNINFNPYFYSQNIYHGNYNYKNDNNISNVTYSDEEQKLAKNAMSLLKTQSGSQILKEKSLANSYFVNELLFPEIKFNLKEICCDIFGSSLMITLLDILSNKNIDSFLSLIGESLFDICLTEPGSRVIQKLLEKICQSTLLINKFIFTINSKDIGILIKSKYGNYIFRKYLSKVKNKEYTYFIYNYIYKNFIELIKEKYGICVVIKALSEADKEARKKIYENTFK